MQRFKIYALDIQSFETQLYQGLRNLDDVFLGKLLPTIINTISKLIWKSLSTLMSPYGSS